MPVPNSMADLSTLASSNFPTGTESIGNSLDNYIRAVSAIIRSTNAIASSTIASASTTDIAQADGECVTVTGSATINSLGSGFSGCYREVRFAGACTLVNSASIQLQGGNIVTAVGTVLSFRCLSAGVWALASGNKDFFSVQKSGDTMSGALGLANPGQAISFGGTGSGQRYYVSYSDTNFDFNACDLSGGYSSTPLTIARATGKVTLRGGVNSAGSVAGYDFEDRGNPALTWAWYASGGRARLFNNTIGDAINIDTPGNLSVVGNIISNSDESLKTEWLDLRPDLVECLAALKSGDYTRIDTGQRQTGVGAQSLEEFMPLAVQKDDEGLRSVAYGNAALVGVVAVARRLLELEKKLEAP